MRLIAAALFTCVAFAAEAQTPPAPPTAPPLDAQQALAAGPKGSLAIRGVQGSKGGPEVGADEVEVVLFHQNQPVHQLKAVLDEHGIVVVRDLPVAMAVRPVVRIRHAGVLYQEVGPTMAADKPDAAMEVTVYETTEETPPWKVTMRHLAAQRAPIGLVMAEMLVVDNPADRTWLGAPPDAQNRRATVSVELPKGASEVQLSSGFHGWCCTEFAGDVLKIQMPLMPGRMTYKFAYRVPEPGGRADLRVSTPVPTEQIVFMLPPEGETADLTLVQAMPGGDTAGGRVLQAQSVNAGDRAGLVLASLPTPPVPVSDPVPARARAAHTKIIVGVACGAAVLVALVMVVRRKMMA